MPGKRPSILPIIDGSRPYNVAQTAKRPPIGRPNVGQTTGHIERVRIDWMAWYAIARRRINARPAASDVGQRLAAIGTTSAVDGLSIAVYNRRWRNSKSYRRHQAYKSARRPLWLPGACWRLWAWRLFVGLLPIPNE